MLAVAGPVLITAASLPFKAPIGPAGILFTTMLIVVAVALMGGAGPALTSVVVGVLAQEILFSRPYGSLRVHHPADVVVPVAFVVVAGAVGIMVDELRRLADEQAALRRVATLVARATAPEELFAVVTAEAGRLLSVEFASVARYESDGTLTFVGSWSAVGPLFPAGTRRTVEGKNVATLVAQTGLPARMDRYADASGPIGDAVRQRGHVAAVGTPITVEGRLWGVLAVPSTDRRLAADTETRLAGFSDLLATAIANDESRAALAASRARLVAAGDETRRQIERDLHDGAQQRLVSLGLSLRAAQAVVPAQLGELNGELSRVAEGLTSVLEELREIARGIHPAVLAEGGLGPALRTLARRSPIPVQLEVRAAERLPERIEVATYYVVAEVLTNAAKHAHASVVNVDVEAVDGVLRITVRDDGAGGADPTGGSGLIGLRDRVEALGGEITVLSPLGAGTAVHVALPLAPS
jgi:signal transduction histidine kinase